jgi:hypothetical protein
MNMLSDSNERKEGVEGESSPEILGTHYIDRMLARLRTKGKQHKGAFANTTTISLRYTRVGILWFIYK